MSAATPWQPDDEWLASVELQAARDFDAELAAKVRDWARDLNGRWQQKQDRSLNGR